MLTFRNRDYLVIQKRNCTKCVTQIVLFSSFVFCSMFIRTTPTVVTFVLCILLRLAYTKLYDAY